MKPKYRCIMCMQDCETNYCPRCESNFSVVDSTKPHSHHWSRRTINSVECKICGKVERIKL
jgi:hypothetical protein